MFGRKRSVDSCPNRLFLSYLRTWRDEAAQKESKSYHTYNKAYKTLEKYPLPLESGGEANILENFGTKICTMLDARLDSEARDQGLTGRQYLERSRVVSTAWWTEVDKHASKPEPKGNKKKKLRNVQTYIPLKNSGAYALLLTLHTYDEWMTKAELQQSAQPLATKSFTVPNRGTFYTAWNSMATLLNKDLVQKQGHPVRYRLTVKGQSLARQIEARDPDIYRSTQPPEEGSVAYSLDRPHPTPRPCRIDLTRTESNEELNPTSGDVCLEFNESSSSFEEYFLRPGSFRVVLCVDLRELAGGEKTRKKEMRRMLTSSGIDYVERVLHVGDFTWIAQEQASRPRELVLDYIVERKCLPDLAQSIRDKRYREQKVRLKESGIPNIIYLIEDFGQVDHQSLPASALRQALVNTLFTDHISVKFCDDMSSTAEFLKLMTTQLKRIFELQTLKRCPTSRLDRADNEFFAFEDFNNDSTKSKGLKVSELLIKQLMQLRGMSYEKALAITFSYPTPAALYRSYSTCRSTAEKESLLSNIKFGCFGRNLGPSLSRSVFYLYNRQ